MNADHFRELYAYHMIVNRKLWDECIRGLSIEQLQEDYGYSHGTVHAQLVHLMSVDARWFAGLRGEEPPDHADPADYSTLDVIRAKWDEVEAGMQTYLEMLTADMLAQPFRGELHVWQVLFHVVNHSTDHRAQILATLDKIGVETFAQDYAYYVFGRL